MRSYAASLNNFIPIIQSMLTLHDPQVAMRQLETAWQIVVADGSVVAAGAEWHAVTDSVAWLRGYEQTSQFCNRAAGDFDHIELFPRVRQVQAQLGVPPQS